MVFFRRVRRGGRTEMQQMEPGTPVEPLTQRAPPAARAPGKVAGAISPKGPSEESVTAFEELVAGLHTENANWAKGLIPKLETTDQVLHVASIERAHPTYKPGRTSVINKLQERFGEVGGLPDGFNQPDPRGTATAQEVAFKTQASGIPCPCTDEGCAFSAGSQPGLDAHIETHHPEYWAAHHVVDDEDSPDGEDGSEDNAEDSAEPDPEL